IADSLALPLGTVKSRLHAAVASFASSWKLACARRGVTAELPPPVTRSDSGGAAGYDISKGNP
ncbi:MAG: secretion protein HlyD, partial [Phycisphaerales bacterium]